MKPQSLTDLTFDLRQLTNRSPLRARCVVFALGLGAAVVFGQGGRYSSNPGRGEGL